MKETATARITVFYPRCSWCRAEVLLSRSIVTLCT